MAVTAAYHLVCRDCDHEQVVESAGVARQQATDHEAITGHRIAFKRVV